MSINCKIFVYLKNFIPKGQNSITEGFFFSFSLNFSFLLFLFLFLSLGPSDHIVSLGLKILGWVEISLKPGPFVSVFS